jgi:hypothetical protein
MIGDEVVVLAVVLVGVVVLVDDLVEVVAEFKNVNCVTKTASKSKCLFKIGKII